MIKFFSTLVAVLVSVSAQAQMLTTAETLGKGKRVVAITENHLYDTDVDLNVAYALYGKGLTDKFDLFVGVGHTNILGENQAWVAIGENAKLLALGKTSVSLFTFTSVPLHRFEDASMLFVNAAGVVSRPVSEKLTLYTGVNTFIPIGNRDRGLFTPTENQLNYPIGASFAVGNWGLTGEVDLGKLKAFGLALSKTF